MIDNVISAIKGAASELSGFAMVDYYEGQFEDLDSFIINPPALLIEASEGSMLYKAVDSFEQIIRLYLVTSQMKGQSGNTMYEKLDTVRKAFHNKTIVVEGSPFYSYVTGWSRLGIFPGFCVYEILLKLEV